METASGDGPAREAPLASAAGPDPRPEPPDRPGDNECCQSGCEPCIFDMYAEDLAAYRQALRAWG